MGFRDYNPGLNRFLTRDTYTSALADLNLTTDPYTGNRYAFAGGNPISRIEIDGHWWDWIEDTAEAIGDAASSATEAVGDAAGWTVDKAVGAARGFDEVSTEAWNDLWATGYNIWECRSFSSAECGHNMAALGGVVEQVTSDPLGTSAAMWNSIVDPIAEHWQAGREGEAIGRGIGEVFGTIGGLVTKLGRVDIPNSRAKRCSFTGETTVLMADGSRKPIEDVKVGDWVIATDPETGEQVAKRVTHVFVHNDTVIDLVVAGDVITTTEDHPFWSATDQRFERADQLSPGEQVLGAEGQVITVSGLRLGTARDGLAYNLSIEGIHTYHIGQNDILIHNDCLTALRDWSSRRYHFGNVQFQLDKSGLSHILQRHHPSYWDGTTKARQTFFDDSMSIADVENAIGAVARQNRDQLINIGAGTRQVQGTVDGIDYVLGVSGGRIRQFYPGVLP
ncbi:Protein of unknown function (DUF1557) [Saccharomonospora marina XMU15]|uniref:Hint domain-containing protein n=1 Tax=Saccharomonospora marina XMU15 TaxID=882083 RepID=H5X1W7_9PSEU|nr:polymorphic toxin-type HINT domain-containing protein [Saccharomonospora marina]EHR52036.1 Protein of unknown function (DUF1557) [Saccharomonospora marina XMU15]